MLNRNENTRVFGEMTLNGILITGFRLKMMSVIILWSCVRVEAIITEELASRRFVTIKSNSDE